MRNPNRNNPFRIKEHLESLENLQEFNEFDINNTSNNNYSSTINGSMEEPEYIDFDDKEEETPIEDIYFDDEEEETPIEDIYFDDEEEETQIEDIYIDDDELEENKKQLETTAKSVLVKPMPYNPSKKVKVTRVVKYYDRFNNQEKGRTR